MSVLIRGMEMPTSCRACLYSRTDIRNVDWCVLTEKDLPCDCPIIPVPPHGRLIEADRIELYMQDEWMNNELSNGDWILFRERLNETPTIIPAEEGE